MFPLGTPLQPYTGIPLHVFEDRYRALVADCLDGDRRFGVVQIERGSEVGGGDTRRDVGTLAEIGDAATMSDGRSVIIAVGVARIRVVEWLPDAPYPQAVVEELAEQPASVGPEEAERIAAAVRRVAAMSVELGDPSPPIDTDLSPEPIAAAHQALALLPVSSYDAQRVLEIDDPDRRIATVVALLEDLSGLLELRLAE
jgi:Lon protease-like protein